MKICFILPNDSKVILILLNTSIYDSVRLLGIKSYINQLVTQAKINR